MTLMASEVTQAWESVERMFAVITFDPQGHVLDANPLFLAALGYEDKAELIGQHHRMFCTAAYVASAEYRDFWTRLASGERLSGSFRRVCKDGHEIYLYAEYAPLRDAQGQVVKVLKVAQNISHIAEGMGRQLGINPKLANRLMTLELQRDPSALGRAATP